MKYLKELNRMQMSYNPGMLYGMEPVMDHTPTKENLSFISLVDTSPYGSDCETVPIDPEKRSSRSNTCSIDWSLYVYFVKRLSIREARP